MFIEIRDPHTKKLLLRFDPDRDIVEVHQRTKRGSMKTLIDLSEYRTGSAVERQNNQEPTPEPA